MNLTAPLNAATATWRSDRHRHGPANLMIMATTGDEDDARLAQRALHDPAAFAELYRRHVQAVHAFVRRRTNGAHDADDITAVTFERALRALPKFDTGGTGVLPWLYRIATNEIIDQARKRSRQQSDRSQRALRLLHDPSAPDAHTTGDPALIAALDRLPDRYNTVLSLRFIAGLEPSEVATHMGITEGNCAVLTHRALAALRKQLDKDTH